MSKTLDLFPLGKSPEQILTDREEEKPPRQYAKEIFTRYLEHERLFQVDHLVPKHLRAMVREYLSDWAMRERALRASAAGQTRGGRP